MSSKTTATPAEHSTATPAEHSTASSGKEAGKEPPRHGDKKAMDSDGASGSGLPGKHTCGKCNYSTRNKILYDNHNCDQQDDDNNLEEQTLIVLTVDEAKKFHCSECDVWAQGHAFEEHLMCHIILKPYQCLYCSQCFVNRRDIGRHVVKEHVGMKMNCALRALKRAKGLMKATLESGKFQFYACVAGKVPLPGDPDKSKSKQKKSKNETDSSGKNPTKQPVSSGGSAPAKDSSSAVKPSRHGSEDAASGATTESSRTKTSDDASSSSKILQEPKGQHLSSNQATADSHHKPDTPSSISECRSSQVAEGREKTGSEVGQKTAVSSEPASPGTDRGTKVVAASSETAGVTDGENETAHSDNSGDTKAETVDTTVNRAKPTNIGSKLDETGSVSASATSGKTQTSKDALDSSSELDKPDKLDKKSHEAMDRDCEKELTVIPATEINDIKDVSAGGEALDTTTADNIGTDSNCKPDEMIDSGNRTEDGSPAAPEMSDSMSKTDNDSDPNMKTNQSIDNVEKMEDSSQSLQSTDNVLKGEESLPASTSETNETDPPANTEDSMDITSSSKNEASTTVISESSVSVTKEETPADETTLSEGKGEDKTDPPLETEKSANSPKETDDAMDTSCAVSDTLDCSNKTEQPKTDDAEEKSGDAAETGMEIGHQSGDVDSKDKSSNENELHEQSKDAVVESDEKDSDTSEPSNKNTDSHDARKVDSMEVEEAPSIAAENDNIVSTNTATAESENSMEKNSKLKPDSSRRDTSSDSLNKEDKECSKAKDLEFPTSNFDQSEEEETGVGLKIVAAFSLQGEGTKDNSDTDSQTSGSKARAERNASKKPETASKDSKPEASGTAPGTDAQESNPAARTLGPPSKPLPSSSFLGVSPSTDPIASQGLAPRQVPQKNCFFFVCGFSCSFSSLTSPEFRDHLMLDHAGESTFRCFHCGYQSPSEDGLVRHISAHAHTYSKSVPLYICGASACKFGSNLVNDFITHQSAWHLELTTFHCHDCDERFDCIEDLLRHFEANFLHIINCPHCTAKTTERRTLLNHISAAHPGKPKMVSVAKQIVCRDRKLNSYAHFTQMRNQTVVSVSASSPGPEQSGASYSRTKSLVSILTQPIQPQERELTRQAQEQELTRQMQDQDHQAPSAASNNQPVKVETIVEDDDDFFQDTFDDSFDEEEYGIQGQGHGEISYMGSKPDDREVDNFKCQFCTFIARDRCRLEGHERCHGLPPSRKSRFKCMYCPQGFNNEHKFSSHVSCHPGLIKFSLYCCKYCDFDSNQRHIIVKHVRSTRDQVHMSCETNEEDMYAVLNKSMETRVLECNQCSYMTRHRKHLVAHLKREHSNLRKTGITVDCDIVEKYPSQSIGANRNKALEMALSHDNAAQLPVGDEGFVKENQARRFKCPICQYLVPRAADLKAHVKRHSEIGEITLVMFRCKYCSAASTAREIIYGHLMEKHLGKQIALVKRIVTIDTKGNDNGYAVTSMEDEDGQGEGQNSPEGGESSAEANKAVLVISDSSGETFPSIMQCPSCAFGSYSRKTIIQHVSNHHPEVSIMGRRQDNELYPLETTYTTPAVASAAARFTLGESLKGEILIVPDSQTFDEAVLCPKCDYATIHRRNIVLHLEQKHPEVSVMGRNDYPTFDGKGRAAVEANATGKDGMVIIGSGSLDEKIRCLYENFGDRMKCMICQAERPKKFFIHVHILRHLNILLWGCQFCSHKGLQKYKMMDHIKKVHPGRAFCIRYLPVNVEERVNQYLQNASMIRARRSGEDGDIAPSKSPTLSPGFQGSGGDGDLNTLRMKYKASQDRLSGCTIGSEELDMKLACLYSVGSDNRYRCVVCGQEFQRKFAVHRHIVQSHLRVNLIGCGYCELEGVERHIMMDHIIETHKNAPISMRNLAQNLENKVAEFLSRMTLAADDAVDISASELGMDSEFKLPEPPQLSLTQVVSSPLHGTPPHTPSPSTSSGKNQLNPNLLLLGRDVLHKHLACMIKEMGSTFRCEVCKWDFPRKYAVHRHILMKHLKVGIIGCPYCSFEGVERYQVFTHIREDHKDADLSLRYLSVDLDAYVAEFMNGVANGTVDMYSKATPPWSMKKTPKKEAMSDEDSQEARSTSSEGGQGLVVAMFGKKSGITIKEEPKDEDDDALGQEPMDREVNGDEGNLNYEMFMGVMGSDGEREVSSTSLLAANGTKAKVATDVQTNIRVITIKEKGFKRHICEKCKFTSLHRSNIVRHIYRVHEQYREHECPVCNYKTLSRVLIEQHLKNEHPGTPVPEAIRSKNLKRKFDMSREELEYDSMKKCKAAATSKRREADLPLLNSTSTQLYACAYCNFETMTHLQIVQHTRDNHSLGEPMKKKEEEEDVKDKDILKQAQDDSAFENAVNTVKMGDGEVSRVHDDTLWQCFYCSFKTASEEDLKVHFAETHPGNVYHAKKVPAWRFVCRSCHVKTRAHSKMRYHLNRHINYRPYTCTTCGSFYPSPDQCRKHCRANSHNETFTYVKIPRKERRLQELLKECQEIAAAMARNPASAEANSSSYALSHPIPSKRKAKKSFPAHSKMRRNYEYDAAYSPRGTSAHVQRDDRPKDDSAVMVCAGCDFSAQNVCDVWLHFIREHQEQEFRWLDSSTGYICTETGEITNAKDVPPDLEAPPGPGYTTMSSRLLSCEHCEFTTSTVQAMKSHLRRHLPKRYLCPYCSLRCSRRDTINQHVRCGHKGRELWTIFFRLPEGFVADSDNAESNMDTSGPATSQGEDAGDQPLESAGSRARSAAIRERIKCGRCDERRESVAAVYKHHREDHSDQSFLWVDVTNGYTCNHSGVVIDAKEQAPHLFTQDGYSVEQDSGNVSTYCCKFCPFNSAFVQAIKSHMKSHLPHGFMCPYCTMTSNSKEKMMSHQSCMHREDNPWILHLRMPTESSSASAVALESNDGPSTPARGVTQYTCNECDYASENLYQYRLHLANHGSFPHLVKDIPEDLPYRCGYCVYVAEDEGDFGAHIASHLERRNFRCSKCEYTAFKHSAVQTHIQTTHDETEEIEVIDLQAQNVSEQGGSVEEPQLVNLEPKVKVVPVNDLDLDREGLTLFSPPSTPDEEGQERRMEGEDMNIIGLETPSIAELDNQSDSTEEWGGNDDDASREGSPAPSDHTPTPPRTGNSILRLTLQGKLTGEYGIKRAVPADKEGDLSDGSASGDSVMSAPSDAEDDPSPDMAQHEDDSSPERPDEEDQDEVEEENDYDEEEIENDGDNANTGNDNCEDEEVEHEVDEYVEDGNEDEDVENGNEDEDVEDGNEDKDVENGNEDEDVENGNDDDDVENGNDDKDVENGNDDEDVEMENEEDRSPEEAENSVGFEPVEEEEEDGEGVGEGSDEEEEECMEQGEEEEGAFNS